MERKIDEYLLEWKNRPRKNCLLIKGARQVGKTYSIDKFGRSNYDTYIYINFETDKEKWRIFDGDLDIKTLEKRISAMFPDLRMIPGKTLIFLDEIQNCPNARVALKPFSLDGRFDVVASGSLLGLNFKEVSSYPVGYETEVEMYSMDFEEFLWALGYGKDFTEDIRTHVRNREKIDDFVLGVVEERFRWYIATGGMPRAVEQFVETNNFHYVLEAQKDIVSGYLNDISKYAVGPALSGVGSCFRSIPIQLAKKNKKFVFTEIEDKKGVGLREYEGSLMWLYDAGIINYCHNLRQPALPLASNVMQNSFKVYLRDTGLLVSMMETGIQFAILDNDLLINEGGIMENVAADLLAKQGYKLTYFETKQTLEVDFILNIKGLAVALAIKSGNNTKSKSLGVVMSKYGVKRGMKFGKMNVGTDGAVECYPLFALAFIDDAWNVPLKVDTGKVNTCK
ncbi:MAG: AAA family ATPase [Candidatus Methanoplasma sp.]|jgi:predicted AAA+ superfamily ATPase|nr:AAA family ATPase [Candidatus Methanoplasma sp.]